MKNVGLYILRWGLYHIGDGIGAACYLSYFPHNNTYAFMAVNIGTAVPSPIFDNTSKLVDDIFDILIQ